MTDYTNNVNDWNVKYSTGLYQKINGQTCPTRTRTYQRMRARNGIVLPCWIIAVPKKPKNLKEVNEISTPPLILKSFSFWHPIRNITILPKHCAYLIKFYYICKEIRVVADIKILNKFLPDKDDDLLTAGFYVL